MSVKLHYEDSNWIFCVKPVGVASEEGGMPELIKTETGYESVYCVHRLDKDASGVMVYAKNKTAAGKYSVLSSEKQIIKEYTAVVSGSPQPAEGSMEDLLFHDSGRNKTYVVNRERRGVRKAKLDYKTLSEKDGNALVLVRLHTGRTHQIRVQFASRGMPLLGDRKYGSSERCPLALFSSRIAFTDPFTGKTLDISCAPDNAYPWSAFDLEKPV